jgi:hypothetical protein
VSLTTIRPSWWVRPIVRYIVAICILLFGWIGLDWESAATSASAFLAIDFVLSRIGAHRRNLKIVFYGRLAAYFVALALPVFINFAFDINDALNCENSPNCTVVGSK